MPASIHGSGPSFGLVAIYRLLWSFGPDVCLSHQEVASHDAGACAPPALLLRLRASAISGRRGRTRTPRYTARWHRLVQEGFAVHATPNETHYQLRPLLCPRRRLGRCTVVFSC